MLTVLGLRTIQIQSCMLKHVTYDTYILSLTFGGAAVSSVASQQERKKDLRLLLWVFSGRPGFFPQPKTCRLGQAIGVNELGEVLIVVLVLTFLDWCSIQDVPHLLSQRLVPAS